MAVVFGEISKLISEVVNKIRANQQILQPANTLTGASCLIDLVTTLHLVKINFRARYRQEAIRIPRKPVQCDNGVGHCKIN